MTAPMSGQPVVVGVDGSASALSAALWAAHEAAGRGVPLRLFSVVAPDTDDAVGQTTRDAAGAALRAVQAAIPPTDRTARTGTDIETEIATGHPVTALLQASAEASLLCVGAVGFRHFADGHIGSTAQTLAERAFCPVAIIRDGAPADGPVVAIVDDLADATTVLQLATTEAVLRGTGLCVLAASERSDANTADRLNRAMAPWAHAHPGLDITVTVATVPLLDHLARAAGRPQLLVIQPADAPAYRELFSPNGYALLQQSRSAVLVATDNRAL